MDFRDRYGPWALVTGAAQGLGAEFARQLAERGLDLILVDRDAAALEQRAAEIRNAQGRQVVTVVLDLCAADFLPALRKATAGKDIGLLINNAGISHVGPFLDQALDAHLQATRLNVLAPLQLTHAYAQAMRERGRGGVILLSSMSALQGTAQVANYAGTKAYNRLLAESLWQEWRGQDVDVMAVLPGQTLTPGFTNSGVRLDKVQGPVMDAASTVRESLRALGTTPSFVPGAANRMVAFLLQRLLPRSWAIALVGRSMGGMYRPE